MRLFAPSAVLSVVVPALLALPVATPPDRDPEPVAPKVQELAVSGVDASALGAEPPAARRPHVLTSPRATGPFTTIGVTWAAGSATPDVTVQVRTRTGGTWGDWAELEVLDAEGPDARSREARGKERRDGTSPSWTGESDGVQVRVDVPVTGRAPRDVQVALIDAGRSPLDDRSGRWEPAATAEAAAAQPTVISREEWGADESLRKAPPSYSSTIKVAYVHHTATTNSYSMDQAAAQVRGIYAYHTTQLGWSDIGYNFLVDRYGRIYEGRYGGTDRPVIGAHAGGFNTSTMGVAMLGTHTSVTPSSATLTALDRLLAWKLSLHERDPEGTEVLTSAGGSSSRYPAGTEVRVPVIAGHRDTNSTACPGDAGYSALPGIRSRAAELVQTTSSNPIDAKHAALGGDDGLLGAATAAEKAVAGGRYRTYQHGHIYWSSTTGAHEVHGDVLGRYLAMGGPASVLGFPTSDEVAVKGGRANSFSGGNIYWSMSHGAKAVYGAIFAKYVDLGGSTSVLGLPTSDEVAVRGGRMSVFQHGRIYWSSATGAREVRGAILAKYLAMAGPDGLLGLPTTDELGVRNGRMSAFERGRIYWSSGTGAREVHGLIAAKYLEMGGSESVLGLPTSDETDVRGGRLSTFQGGRIYWSSQTGAHEVHGLIHEKYVALKAHDGVLGLPTSDESVVVGGRASAFQGGTLYWSASTGAQAVRGIIRDKYLALGGTGSVLGLPLTDETALLHGRESTFAGGRILWSTATGAREVRGEILRRYLHDGGARTYGFPVSDEYAVAVGRESRFEKARITWDAATGRTTVSWR